MTINPRNVVSTRYSMVSTLVSGATTKQGCQCCCHAKDHPCDVDTWDCEHCRKK